MLLRGILSLSLLNCHLRSQAFPCGHVGTVLLEEIPSSVLIQTCTLGLGQRLLLNGAPHQADGGDGMRTRALLGRGNEPSATRACLSTPSGSILQAPRTGSACAGAWRPLHWTVRTTQLA